MAYREFDPTAMKDYQDKAVSMFNKQIEAANNLVKSKKKEKEKKEKEKEKAEKLSTTATKTIWTKNGIETVPDTDKQEAERKKAETLGVEISNLENEIDALNSAVESLNNSIAETNTYINNLMKSIEELDSSSETKIMELIGDINTYKGMLRKIYNTMDDTLVDHGYSRDVNIQQQFANTVDDWGDSTLVNKFPYIPEKYIYHDGVLNERILSGIFQKDPKTVIDKQYTQITNILSDIADKEAWNNLAALINTGYAFFAETGGYQDPGRAYMQTQTFKELVNRYSIKNINKIFSSIISGKTIEQLTDYERKQLQASAVLNSFASEWPVIMTGSGKGTPFTIEKDSIGRTSGVRINISSGLTSKNIGGSSWFISNFKNDLSKDLGDFIADNARSDKGNALKIFVQNSLGNKILGYLPGLSNILEASTAYGDYITGQSEFDNTITLGDLSSVLNTMTFGGTLSVGRNGTIGVDNSILGLNGANGFGVAMEAYNHYKGTHIDAESFYAGYMGQSGNFNLPTIPKDNPFLNLTNWLKEQGHNNRDLYTSIIISIGEELDSESSYMDYKKVITDPELSKELAERLSKQSGA